MGMDVYGTKKNTYFRASIWSWAPIWMMVEALAPQLAVKVPDAYHNIGDGLNAEDATALGIAIANYLAYDPVGKTRDQFTAPEPNPLTERADAMVATIMEFVETSKERGLAGKEPQIWPPLPKPGEDRFVTSREHLQEFATFCLASGGFEIR